MPDELETTQIMPPAEEALALTEKEIEVELDAEMLGEDGGAEEDEDEKNKLSLYDAYRFRAVVEEAVERLDLLSAMITDAGRKKNKNNEGEGDMDGGGGKRDKDVYHLMVNQKDLEDKYEILMQRRSQLRGLANKSKYLQNQAELKEVATQLRESTSTITQSLNDQPTSSNTQKLQKDTDSLADVLRSTGKELRVQTFDVLVENVNQRIVEQRRLWKTQLAHEKTREALKNLETELREERERFSRVAEEKNANISKLTAELKQLKRVTMLSLKYEKETALAQRDTLERMRKRRLDGLREEIFSVQDRLERDNDVNQVTTDFLTKRREDLNKLKEEWEKKYEAEVAAKEAELNDTQEQRDTALEELDRLRHRWKVDKAERMSNYQEKLQRKTEEQNKKELMKVMNLAQAHIHFLWRVYNRKRPKKKGKGKKGGKKGKKVKVG